MDRSEHLAAHQDMAYNVAYRILGQQTRATEATQRALAAAESALPGFRGPSLKLWLLRIVVQACRRELQGQPGHPPAGPGGAAIGAMDDLYRAVEAGIARLPVEQRVALVLADVQGCSYQEIAAITGASPGAVRSRLSQARTRLRDELFGARRAS